MTPSPLERLLAQVESLRPTGEIGDGKVAHMRALAAMVRAEIAAFMSVRPFCTCGHPDNGGTIPDDCPVHGGDQQSAALLVVEVTPCPHSRAQRQQDEVFCPDCLGRWAVDEAAP